MTHNLPLTDDEQLQEDALEALRRDPSVDSTEVGIEVEDAIVTLTGTVESSHRKRAAELAVLRVPSVRGVANDVVVRRYPSRTPTNTDIVRAAVRALDWSPQIPQGRVKVAAAADRMTLTGAVPRRTAQRAAETIVRRIAPQANIVNLITVAHEDPASIPSHAW